MNIRITLSKTDNKLIGNRDKTNFELISLVIKIAIRTCVAENVIKYSRTDSMPFEYLWNPSTMVVVWLRVYE